jgi:hypothetical protein
MSITNYQGLRITIRQTKDSAVYEFFVENVGDVDLWHLSFSTYELLGPETFGLDDTHMPASLKSEEPAKIAYLERGASFCMTRKKWGGLDRCRGPRSGKVYATFSPHENNDVRYGLNGEFFVEGEFRPASTSASTQPIRPYPSTYFSGFEVGRILRRLFGKGRTD